MPTAEASRSATCEAMIKNDPAFRAALEAAQRTGTLGPSVYLPTRLPRNPDYGAAPLTPIGSALPEFGKSRFGVGGPRAADQGDLAWQTNASDALADPPNLAAETGVAEELGGAWSDREAIAACRGLHGAAGVASLPGDPTGPEARGNIGYSNTRRGLASFDRGRAEIARRDKTLPTAFYLFDQNRFEEALTWFKKAAAKLPQEQGGDEAALFVGKIHLMGKGSLSNPAEGLKWLKRTANSRFNPVHETPVFDPKQPEMNTAIGEAAVILGNIYRTGFLGIAKDHVESRRWYKRALEVGHIAAAKTLGDLHLNGVGTPRDPQAAADYYLKAAKFGLPAAQFDLAELLSAGGEADERAQRRALLWYQAASKHNHPGALYALARAHDLGLGVKPDQQTALGLYKSAALQGHGGALTALGTYFYEGKVVPKDAALARKWFEQAAKRGDPDGTFNLAAMLARGEGGPRNVVGAWGLMREARALGSERAPAALAALEARMSGEEKQAAASSASAP